MKPEKDTHQPAAAVGQIHPLETMRRVYKEMEITFEEVDERIATRLFLKNLEVRVLSWGEPNALVTVVVQLPVRAAPEFRAKAGEFLHRLNFNALRKFWEMDYNDGEIRLAGYSDIMDGPLTDDHFRGMLESLITNADVVFPYLTNVLSGSMTPEFAEDQAAAALCAYWTEAIQLDESDEDPPEDK
jgi:hypothetical protein